MQNRAPARQPPQTSSLISREDAIKIINDGDAEALVKKARELADTTQVSQSQLRRIFGEVRRIEMAWKEEEAAAANRRLILLKPRMRYQAVRRGKELEGLERALSELIDRVEGKRDRFKNFVEFLEAVVAYAKDKK